MGEKPGWPYMCLPLFTHPVAMTTRTNQHIFWQGISNFHVPPVLTGGLNFAAFWKDI